VGKEKTINIVFTKAIAWHRTSVRNRSQLGRKNSEQTAKRDEKRQVQQGRQVQNTWDL